MQVQTNVVSLDHTVADRRKSYSNSTFTHPVLHVQIGKESLRRESNGSHEARLTVSETPDLDLHQDELYAEFRPLVRRLIRQYGDSVELRNDLEGEIYYRFCVLLKAFDPDRGVPLRPYLVRQLTASIYTFARHQWRSQHREVSLELFTSESGPMQTADPTRDWDDALDLQQIKRSLPAAISKLSERQRNVLIWRYYEDSSFEEIADRLAIQAATARSLLRHALNHLRADMAAAE